MAIDNIARGLAKKVLDNKIDKGTDLNIVAANSVDITLTAGKTYEIFISNSYNSDTATENSDVYGIFKFKLNTLPAVSSTINIYSVQIRNDFDNTYDFLRYTENAGVYSLKLGVSALPIIYRLTQLD